MQIKEVLQWGTEQLFLSSPSARLDAEILLSHVITKPTTFLLAHDDDEVGFFALRRYKAFIGKRKEGMPVAYLTGHKEFYFLDFEVDRNVLVPRPDTETLVECVIEYIRNDLNGNSEGAINQSRQRGLLSSPSEFLLLDIGTGSACIPISICKNIDGLTAVATDISKKALNVARRNIKKHGLSRRIELARSDLLKNVDLKKFEKKEVIVTANLPYIPIGYQISPELKYEPPISLFGGEDGMELYKKIVEQLIPIKPRAIFFELFEDQIAILKTRLPDYKLKYIKNMSGKARVMAMERDY
jgi:release factor glutamine methyltransferase